LIFGHILLLLVKFSILPKEIYNNNNSVIIIIIISSSSSSSNKLNQPGIAKETTCTFLESDIFPEMEGFVFSIWVKPFLHVSIYNTLSRYPASRVT